MFSFLRIPDVLMLMTIGIVIGPLLKIVSPDFLGEAGDVLVMLILVLILFEGSTKLKIDSLKNALFGTTSLALISFLFTMSTIGVVLWYFTEIPLIIAFIIGSIIGGNSSAVVIPMLEKIKIKEESKTTLFLESGISDVLSIVFTLALLASLELGKIYIDYVVSDILKNILFAILIGSFSSFLWSLFLKKFHNIKNSSFSTPAFVFIVFGATEVLGYSGLISVIIFGIFLGNIPTLISSIKEKHKFLYEALHPQPLSTRELSFFCEITFLIKIFFFVFIGISLNFETTGIILLGLLLSLLLFIIRIPALLLSLPKNTPRFDASIISTTLPRGLATAVLALIPIQRGLEGAEIIQDTVYSVIFFSIFLSSIMIFLLYNTKRIRKFYDLLLPGFSENPKDGSREYPLEK